MKILLTILSGIAFTFCFAPYYYFVAGFFAVPCLLLILDFADTNLKKFGYGFLFAFCHHVTGLYWVANSLMVEADKFAWLIPFAVSLIPAYLAIYIGIICYLTGLLNYRGFPKMLFFASAWVFAEIIRTYAFTGFPWNLAGYTFMNSIQLAQAASFVGVYGLSLLAILLFSAPYLVLKSIADFKLENRHYKLSFSIIYLLPILCITALLSIFGDNKIKNFDSKFEDTNIRIVQPNIPQKEKFDRYRIGEHIYKHYTLTVEESNIGGFVPDIFIWPEASFLFDLKKADKFRDEISHLIPYSSHLILGSVRYEGENRTDSFKAFNSVEIIDSDGNLLDDKAYNKHHLVPFGEYIPLRKYFPYIEKITHGHGDFNTGLGPQTIQINKDIPPFSPSICYEIIFPDIAIEKQAFDKRAKWIINVTNDGWFGDSSGPYQHLDIARMRAIEQGVPVIRAANTGISALIDANGKIVKKRALNETGIIDSKLPKALPKPTYYSIHGDKIILMVCAAFLIFSAILKLTLQVRRK